MIFDSIEKGLSKKEIVDILNNKKSKLQWNILKTLMKAKSGMSV